MQPNDRVELAPHTDLWMQGDRFGYIDYLTFIMPGSVPAAVVLLDKSRRQVTVPMTDLRPVLTGRWSNDA